MPGDNFPLTGITTGSPVLLYEGLPHDWIEPELLAEELKTKSVVYLDGFPFYEEPRPVAPKDAARLTELFLAEDALTPWEDWKRCGGFHPDFALEWGIIPGACRALICFGCAEILLIGPEYAQKWDINSAYKYTLYDLLIPYHKHRPTQWLPSKERLESYEEWKARTGRG